MNYNDYGSDEALIERIIEIDKNEDLYIKYLNEPFFVNNEVNQYVKEENIQKQFKYIFSKEIVPVAVKSPLFSRNMFIRNSALINREAKDHLIKMKNKFILGFRALAQDRK